MITIRPIKAEDRESFYHLSQKNKERLIDYFPITLEKTETPEVTADSIKMYNLLSTKNELHVLVIENDDTKEMLGIVFLKNIDLRVKKCELAYFIDKDEERKGLTTRAVLHALDMAFNQLQLNKVYCRAAIDNVGSNRVAEKTGFELEGVLKQEFCMHDGSLVDLNYYGIFRKN